MAIAAITLGLATPATSKDRPDEVDHRSDQELVASLGSKIPTERLGAARALAARGEKVLPALIEAIESGDWRARRGATDALIAMR